MARTLPRLALAACALAFTAACTPEALVSFDRVAGSGLDSGSFGNATMNNTMAQTGQGIGPVDLSRRFAAEVPAMINFAFDSATLDAQARAALDRQADWILRFPGVKFRVYGHTDAVGSATYNRNLGQRRADAAMRYMIGRGVERNRLEAVVSYGETQPIVVTEGREPRNRRTVTEVTGFLGNHPMVHDGKYMLFVYSEVVSSATEPHDLALTAGQAANEER
jgi:outer membrane protein OmpA-like peptidoglycan-associated protein